MSEWTKQRLEQLIIDSVEENISLDYKRADSLAKTDGRKTEITKDVSSFANSTGGVLIYGIAEFDDEPRRHLPERLDPIQRSEISKEWLDQIVQSIQPRIENLVIHPVIISESDNTVCYVVEVPQSHTAHMARDHRYYKRHNFTTVVMEDYEVRDVMNRRTHPKIRGFIYVNRNADRINPRNEGIVTVKLENIGSVLARHVAVDLEIPLDMEGPIAIEKPVWIKTTEEGSCQVFRLVLGQADGPLFPHSESYLRRIFQKGVRWGHDRRALSSTVNVKVNIFADEMPPIRATLENAAVLSGMTPIESPKSPT